MGCSSRCFLSGLRPFHTGSRKCATYYVLVLVLASARPKFPTTLTGSCYIEQRYPLPNTATWQGLAMLEANNSDVLGIATAPFLCRYRARRRNGFQLAITVVVLVVSTAGAASASFQQSSACLSDPHLNAVLELVHGGPIPQNDSCCMMDVCGLTCPQEIAPPDDGTFGRVRIPSHIRIFLQQFPFNLYSQLTFR
jgi:hypothetical protein